MVCEHQWVIIVAWHYKSAFSLIIIEQMNSLLSGATFLLTERILRGHLKTQRLWWVCVIWGAHLQFPLLFTVILLFLFRSFSPRSQTALCFCSAPTTRNDPTTWYLVKQNPALLSSVLNLPVCTHWSWLLIGSFILCRSNVWFPRPGHVWTWNWEVCLPEWDQGNE